MAAPPDLAAPDTPTLVAALEATLRSAGDARRVVRLERRPSAYRSSFAIEELDVALDDGAALALVLKRVDRAALSDSAHRAKPAFLSHPAREPDVYRLLLAPAALGTARCFAVASSGAPHAWLLLERVPGVELYQVGRLQTWEQVARWLARLHLRFAADARAGTLPASLLRYDRAFLELWSARAAARADRFAPSRTQRAALGRLLDRYGDVVERLLALPPTLIHGECYASNVLVQPTPAGLRVCPIDWEMAAVGPGLVDLAALVAGGWQAAQRRRIADAYHAELCALGADAPRAEQLLADLDRCRLHLALQWIGWADDWTPPPQHAHDWLADALALGARLLR